MDFEKIKITEIVPATYNPRTISDDEYKKLSNSISEFGFVDPIIINLKNNHIIGGHQRYDVLMDEYMGDNEKYKELFLIELGDIGWVFPSNEVELGDLKTEKALNLALNRISGEWNNEQLENLLIDLDIDGFDISLTGFDNLDMKDLDFDVKISSKKTTQKTKQVEEQSIDETTIEEQPKSVPPKIDDEETVFNGLNDEVKETKRYKCPKCGFEWD